MSGSSLEQIDGRTARRDRNRVAVLDAVLALFVDDVDPTPENVALRCGLSPRSVYRYFEDRDELLRAAIERQLELIYPLQLIEALGHGTLDERVQRFVAARVSLYVAVAPLARAARRRVSKNAAIGEQLRATRRTLREQVELQFARELGALVTSQRRDALSAIDALSQFESLEYFTETLALSPAVLRSLLARSTHSLLTPTT